MGSEASRRSSTCYGASRLVNWPAMLEKLEKEIPIDDACIGVAKEKTTVTQEKLGNLLL